MLPPPSRSSGIGRYREEEQYGEYYPEEDGYQMGSGGGSFDAGFGYPGGFLVAIDDGFGGVGYMMAYEDGAGGMFEDGYDEGAYEGYQDRVNVVRDGREAIRVDSSMRPAR
jgi:hypothetical protein